MTARRQPQRKRTARERLLDVEELVRAFHRGTSMAVLRDRQRRRLREHEREAAERGMSAVPVRGRRGSAAYMASLTLGRAVYTAILGPRKKGAR